MPARTRPDRRTSAGHPVKKPVGRTERAAVERLRKICLALPGATEKLAWGEPTWRAGKIFAQMDTHHHGADRLAVWLPMRPGVQQALVAEDPERFFRPPYVGQNGWVGVRIDRRPDWRIVEGLVRDAYRAVAPAQLDAAPGRTKRGWRAAWLDHADDAGS
jgi:hypothetical protein